MINDSPKLISIKDAEKHVFNTSDYRLTASGIQTWMRWNLFWPYSKVEAKDQTGCELDEFDLTWLSTLRSISYCGVRLGSFGAREKGKVGLRDQLAVNFGFDRARLSKDQNKLLDSNRADKRPFQRYFEWHNAKVWCVIETKILKGLYQRSNIPMSEVWFCPESQLDHNVKSMIKKPELLSHCFIAIKPHHGRIRSKLEKMPETRG